MTNFTSCPTCGSKRINRVRKDETREYKGRAFVVKDLEFEECPDCGERLYDGEAMRKIEAASPAFAKRRRRLGRERRAATLRGKDRQPSVCPPLKD